MCPGMGNTEKRQQTRVDVTFPCLCEEGADPVDHISDAVVLDLSFGGVLIACGDVLPVGTEIVLTPISPGRELLAPLRAEIVRVHGDVYMGHSARLGARFHDLDPEQRRCLLWLMNNSPQTPSKEALPLPGVARSGVSHCRMRMRLWLSEGKRTSSLRAA